MTLFTELLLELGAVVGTVLLNGYLILACRNPHRPRWLRTEFAQMAAPVVFLTASCLTFAALVNGVIEAGIKSSVALPIAVLTATVIAVLIGWIFGFRARLARADAGENPFSAPRVIARTPHALQSGGDAR